MLRGGLHQESLPGREPAERQSSEHHAESRGELPTVAQLLQVCSERNCAQNEENSCHLDVRGGSYFPLTFNFSAAACLLLVSLLSVYNVS